MTTVMFGPSEKQVAFIKSLLSEREIDEDVAQQHLANLPTMDKTTASILISSLLQLPKAERTNALQQVLATIPKSKYAVHIDEFEFENLDANFHGDLVFLEVREYMKNLYMRQLTGAVGGFTRHRLTNEDVTKIVKIIEKDPYKYARLFGEHYSCCGCCGAELTDPVSRELQLGPECRKRFGK